MGTARQDALNAVKVERQYQELVQARNNEDPRAHSLGDWLIFIERQIVRAKDELYSLDSERVRHRMRKIAALAVAAMETQGIRDRSTFDMSAMQEYLSTRP